MPREYILSKQERKELSAHLINVTLLMGVAFGAYTTWFRFEVLEISNGRTTDDIEAWIVSLTLALALSLRFAWTRYLWRRLLWSTWWVLSGSGRAMWFVLAWITGRRSSKEPALRPDPKLARDRYMARPTDWMRLRRKPPHERGRR
ncbi:MAG: hypothetical protein EPO55_20285 [Reyranella sp.]|uniref:hypothetical protein n=1 Tax=Reyranella sp. TaxID=1929291 RepID=UPI001218CF2A|nr:hypothetical protein [Reyranella sp.]TAJ36866.1 MAG: hypothetical protein EPO55_20285 [Reyranella sp.]